MKTLQDYQKLAARTSGANGKSFAPSAFGNFGLPPNDVIIRIETCSLGLIGETGELADHIKKVIGHGHKLDPAVCVKELGDVMWYIAEAYSMFGLEIPDADLELILERLGSAIKEQDGGDQLLKRRPLQPVCALIRKASIVASDVNEFIALVLNGEKTDEPWSGYQLALDELLNIVLTVTIRLGFSVREVLEANIEKLKKRYPDGFKSEASINRKE